MTTQNKYITQRQIQKLQKICDIKQQAKIVNENKELSEQEKEQTLILLNDRLIEIRNYKKKQYSKERKEKGVFTLRYNKEELQNLEQDLQLLQHYKQNKSLKLKDLIKLKSLSKDTLKQEEIETNNLKQQQEQKTQNLLKQAITEINKIGNNINQIARDINHRRKVKDKLFNNNLTKEERERMLNATQELEDIVLKITHNKTL